MSQKGNIMFAMSCVCGPEASAEGDRLLASHAAWVEKTHHRSGDLELLSYNTAKCPEYSNPLDPSSPPTGNMVFTLYEVYKNPAGLGDHWAQAQASWQDFGAMLAWCGANSGRFIHGPAIEHSLW